MSENKQNQAKTQGISLFPIHQEIVDVAARQLGLQGNTFSATIQYILIDWARSRGIAPNNKIGDLQNYPPNSAINIGYLRLTDLASALDLTQPVYLAVRVEITHGTTLGQHTDHHYLMVTQPDALNRVHYCRIPVVQLVYHDGIAFAPNYEEKLAKVETERSEVEAWLVGEGFKVWAGMVALPRGVILVDGTFQRATST